MKKLFSFMFLALMAGCSTPPANFNTIIEGQLKLKALPTIQLNCPTGNCTLTYKDPRDTDNLVLPTNGWDALKSVSKDIKDITIGATPWVVTSNIANTAIKNAGGNNNSVNNSSSDSRVDNSLNDSGNDSSIDNSLSASRNNSSVDNSVEDSRTDNSQQNTDRHDTYWTTVP